MRLAVAACGEDVNAEGLVENPGTLPPHVVLLGAGASCAALPKGDHAGKHLPVMNNLVEVVGLEESLSELNIDGEGYRNFEALYSRILSGSTHSDLRADVESRIENYFASLSLPPEITIYDRLLLGLRPTDAVFTFNWDPLLFDSWQRNRTSVPLPAIFFLHGNVRIAACPDHDEWGARGDVCSHCASALHPVPLLYPIETKDYTATPFLARSWNAARNMFRKAFTLTVFGYGAPDSDVEAVSLLHRAWMARSDDTYQHIEIIDIAANSDLVDRWIEFSPNHHYLLTRGFDESRIARWPRRACEAVYLASRNGEPSENFPFTRLASLEAAQAEAIAIASKESEPE